MTDIDPRGVLETLGFQACADLEPLAGGWAHAMWRFQTPDGAPHVLRVYPRPEWASAAVREGRGWATETDLDRIRRWTERWQARAGLAGASAAPGAR